MILRRRFVNSFKRTIATGVGVYSCIVLLTFGGVSYTQQPPTSTNEATGPSVTLNLIVLDAANHSVDKVEKEDVRVIENKLEQKIVSVERDQRPTDIAIAIDASGSFEGFLPYAVAAAKLIIDNRRPLDEISIEIFISSDQIYTVQQFTTDSGALLKGLNLIKSGGGQSAVIDAIYLEAGHLGMHKPNEDRRKVMVIITDGEDRNSYYKAQDATRVVQEKNVQVFALAITTKLDSESGFIRASPQEQAQKLLRNLTKETGGRAFFSMKPKQLSDYTSEIIRNLMTSFRLTYQSSNNSSKGGIRKVEVEIVRSEGKKRTAIAPRSYVFP